MRMENGNVIHSGSEITSLHESALDSEKNKNGEASAMLSLIFVSCFLALWTEEVAKKKKKK